MSWWVSSILHTLFDYCSFYIYKTPVKCSQLTGTACHSLRVGVGSRDSEQGQYKTNSCHRFTTYITRMKLARFLCQAAHCLQQQQWIYKNQRRSYCTLTIQNVSLCMLIQSIVVAIFTSDDVITRSSGLRNLSHRARNSATVVATRDACALDHDLPASKTRGWLWASGSRTSS